MPPDADPPLTDAELDRLARAWFAEARARAEEPDPRRSPADAGDGDAGGGLLDWLLGDGADDGACDGDGDGCD